MIENLLPLAGTVAFGPIGGAVGTALSGAIGMGRANKFEKEFDQANRQVRPVDPMQLSYMQDLKNQERAYRAGTDAASRFAMTGVRDQGATASASILRAGGGPNDLLRSQRISDRGYADIAARQSGIANQLLGMRGGVVNDISDRVFSEQRWNRDMAFGRWQNERKDANNNLMAATGMLAQEVPEGGYLGPLFKGGAEPPPTPFAQKSGAGGSWGLPYENKAPATGYNAQADLYMQKAGPYETPAPAPPVYGNMPTVPYPTLPPRTGYQQLLRQQSPYAPYAQ